MFEFQGTAVHCPDQAWIRKQEYIFKYFVRTTSKYDKFHKKVNELFAAHASGTLTSTELVNKVRHLIHVHS